jgi:hypothetical protein
MRAQRDRLELAADCMDGANPGGAPGYCKGCLTTATNFRQRDDGESGIGCSLFLLSRKRWGAYE